MNSMTLSNKSLTPQLYGEVSDVVVVELLILIDFNVNININLLSNWLLHIGMKSLMRNCLTSFVIKKMRNFGVHGAKGTVRPV